MCFEFGQGVDWSVEHVGVEAIILGTAEIRE